MIRPDEATFEMLSGWPVVGDQLENLWLDFESKFTIESQDMLQLKVNELFTVFVAGALNTINPKSNFNSNWGVSIEVRKEMVE